MRKIFEDLNTLQKDNLKTLKFLVLRAILGLKYYNGSVIKIKKSKAKCKRILNTIGSKKGTSLSDKSLRLTTAAHMVNMIKFLTEKMKFKKQMQLNSVKKI